MNTAYTQEQVATIKAAAIEANAEDDPSLFQGCLIDLMEEWGTWPPKRYTELKEIGRKVIEQDPDCFDADILREFGFAAPAQQTTTDWQPMDTAPTNEMILLTVEDASGERRVFPAEASIEDGNLLWIITTGWVGWKRLQSAWTPVLWQRWLDAPGAAVPPEGFTAGTFDGAVWTRIDVSEQVKDRAVRDHLIAMGWTPPNLVVVDDSL